MSNCNYFKNSRITVGYADSEGSKLHIFSVEVEDKSKYSCEITYLELSETCNSRDPHSINLEVVARPMSILMMDSDDKNIHNSSTIGPLHEGQLLRILCLMKDSRTHPKNVGWYRNGKKINDITTEYNDGLVTVKSYLVHELTRQDLGAVIECRVELFNSEPIVNQIFVDLLVKPTTISLTGGKSGLIEGSRTLLQCVVTGGRPGPNITWYNNTKIIEPNELTIINVKNVRFILYFLNCGRYDVSKGGEA